MKPASKLSPSNLKPHQIAILIAGVVTVVGFLTPVLHNLFLPLYYLNVHLHEFSHALMTILTGGMVDSIQINGQAGGVTLSAGGSHWLIGPAGYLGASIIGATIIWFSRSEKSARNVLRALAVLLALGMILWVRGDAWGIFSGVVWVLALFGASMFLKGIPLLFAAQFVGMQQCLNSLTSLYDLVWISAGSERHSDARIMESYSHIPAIFWAVGWSVVSLSLVVICLRRAWALPTAR